jgi:hypothetical protein
MINAVGQVNVNWESAAFRKIDFDLNWANFIEVLKKGEQNLELLVTTYQNDVI